MKLKLTIAMILAAGVTGSFSWRLRAQDVSSSVWDGVYTQAQADRGKTAYNESCAACHGDQLTGVRSHRRLPEGIFCQTGTV